MNERIRELVTQARNYALDEKRIYERMHNTEQCMEEYREVYNAKFAEVIIRECMKVAVFKDDGYISTADVAGYMAAGRSTAAKMIKEHFGVEE